MKRDCTVHLICKKDTKKGFEVPGSKFIAKNKKGDFDF